MKRHDLSRPEHRSRRRTFIAGRCHALPSRSGLRTGIGPLVIAAPCSKTSVSSVESLQGIFDPQHSFVILIARSRIQRLVPAERPQHPVRNDRSRSTQPVTVNDNYK
jgi:hypothetical protein